jgi:hypothetical protein
VADVNCRESDGTRAASFDITDGYLWLKSDSWYPAMDNPAAQVFTEMISAWQVEADSGLQGDKWKRLLMKVRQK